MSLILDTSKLAEVKNIFTFHYSVNKPLNYITQMELAGKLFPLVLQFASSPSKEVCKELVIVALDGFIQLNPNMNVMDFLDNVMQKVSDSLVTGQEELTNDDSLRGALFCASIMNSFAFSQGKIDQSYTAFIVIPLTWMMVN